MNIVIIRKGNEVPRLTIAKDEIRVKFPDNTDETTENQLLDLFKKIIEEVKYEGTAIRGRFEKGRIRMFIDKKPKVFVKEFKLEL